VYTQTEDLHKLSVFETIAYRQLARKNTCRKVHRLSEIKLLKDDSVDIMKNVIN